jgi:hypothetical protein
MDNEKREAQLQTSGAGALAYVNALEVKDEETLGIANKAIVRIKNLKKEVTDHFGPDIKAANDLHKSLLKKRNVFLDPLNQAEKALNPKITGYLRELERIRQDAIRKAREEEATREAEARKAPLLAPPPPAPVLDIPEAPKLDGIHLRANWKWKVVDFDKIPRMHLTTNDKEINAIVTLMKEKTDIPGIEVYKEESIAKSKEKKAPY